MVKRARRKRTAQSVRRQEQEETAIYTTSQDGSVPPTQQEDGAMEVVDSGEQQPGVGYDHNSQICKEMKGQLEVRGDRQICQEAPEMPALRTSEPCELDSTPNDHHESNLIKVSAVCSENSSRGKIYLQNLWLSNLLSYRKKPSPT